MRTSVLLLLAALALSGQKASQQPKPDLQKQEKPAVTQEDTEKKAEGQAIQPGQTAEQAAQAEAEKSVYGSVELGWMFRTDIGGDHNSYRSMVNVGEGPSLVGADLTFQGPDLEIFNTLRIIVSSWGPSPFTTARVVAENDRFYRFSYDFRNLDYFNFLPSFANPLRETGVFTTQYGFDTTRRSNDAELTLLPNHCIVPFVGWSRGSGSGAGVQNFVLSRNEYTLPTRLSDRADTIRGGVRLELNRVHATLEGGSVYYRDSQELLPPGLTPAFGNLTAPVFGSRLFINSASQLYGVRGDAPFVRGLVTASPVRWATLTGTFLFSQPETDINFTETARGLVVGGGTSLAAAELLLAAGRAIQPHPSGNVTLELRPINRLRIFDSFLTDRFHSIGNTLSTANLFSSAGSVQQQVVAPEFDRLIQNWNQHEINVLFDVTPYLILRGGHRYVWTEAIVPPSIPAGSLGVAEQFGEIKRQAGLAGVTFRSGDRLRVNFDFEGATADQSYFRISLNDYQRARVNARYQLTPGLQLAARFNVLNNNRPRPNFTGAGPRLDYEFLSRDNTASVYWNPSEGRRFSLLAEYSRSTLRSETDYLEPSTLTPELSFYRENAHIGTALVEVPISASAEVQPKISFGGSFYRSTGSRPVRYYQPTARVAVPFGRRVQFGMDWKWYGLSQPYYIFEGFRTHTFVTSLRFQM